MVNKIVRYKGKERWQREVTLKELGTLLQTPVGKSGVNHRLRKLSEMAEKLRAQLGGTL